MSESQIAMMFVRELPDALVTFLVISLAGGGVALFYEMNRKRREVYIDTLDNFHKLYGEFFDIYKEWSSKSINSCKEDLLKRSSSAEGRMESILLKLCAERRLSNKEAKTLGRFRQAFQSLRESIAGKYNDEDQRNLKTWKASDSKGYLNFKKLSVDTMIIIEKNARLSPFIFFKRGRFNKFCIVTDNYWENRWIEEIEVPKWRKCNN